MVTNIEVIRQIVLRSFVNFFMHLAMIAFEYSF